MRAAMLTLGVLLLAGCPVEPPPAVSPLASFRVEFDGVFQRQGTTRAPLGVVTTCVERYGGAAAVPAEVKGLPECRYLIPRGEVEFDIRATALGLDGQPYRDFSGPVSFRIIPGDLTPDLRARWAVVQNGEVTATVRAKAPYGEVRVWVEDAPPRPVFDGGELDVAALPQEPARRTFAAGASRAVSFADQTLQTLQQPLDFDNRTSPFVGEFIVVGKNPQSGETLKQTCTDDPDRNGREALMVVTGLDPAGFFVTDISSCRLVEQARDSLGNTVRTPELPEPCYVTLPDGGVAEIEAVGGGAGRCNASRKTCTKRADCPSYLPGTFGSMFVYNYNFPDGLDEGDLLFTLSGAVQEFTSTTQMVFPAWTVAERVRRLPQEQWNKWLQYAKPYDLSYRTCGMDDTLAPYLTDILCGHNRRNMKMESLESSLVRIRNVRFPTTFKNCDFNANASVPFFCESRSEAGDWFWGTCSFDAPEPETDRVERECLQECVLGTGPYAGTVCSEAATFRGFGQFVVEMASPGPRAAGLDDSLPARALAAALTPGTSVLATGFGATAEVAITCTAPAHYRFGDAAVTASDADPLLSPGELLRHVFVGTETSVAFKGTAAGTCSVGQNAKARINLITKDAVPELNPACSEDDADADRAQQCRNLHGATFDVVGHLRHVQPARPRWAVIPRAPDDLCCRPGPGLGCPRPIQPCP